MSRLPWNGLLKAINVNWLFRAVKLSVVAAIGFQSGYAESSTPATSQSLGSEILYSENFDDGMIFVDGNFVESPYVITATSDAVFVNGVQIDFLQDPFEEHDDGEPGGHGRRGNDSEVPRGAPRRPNQSRDKRVGQNVNQRPTAVRRAQLLCRSLSNGASIILAFPDEPLIPVSPGALAYALHSSFLHPESAAGHQQMFLREVPVKAAHARIQTWFNEYKPSPTVLAKMQAEVDQVDAIEEQGRRTNAAVARLDAMSYPLTLIAMLLGVIALGHILKWTAQSIVTNKGDQISAESVRGSEIALLLMAGMSMVDLVWTILASQAGIMREVNPLAAGIIDSPLMLAAFKVVATSLGFSLLYMLRTQRRGQEVTWWMCLVCVLVTFRWVMFDSMA